MHPLVISPSLLACDFGRLHEEVRRAEAAGADTLHLDVMDGNFVDNITFGPAIVDAIAQVATVPLDVHLMVARPAHYLPRFTRPGRNVTVHVEAEGDCHAMLAAIHGAGCTRGISLRPGTPFGALEPYLAEIDLLLVMTVEPGFGGQPFLPAMLEKVAAAEKARDQGGYGYRIQVDGGVNQTTARQCREAGADTLVAGSALFGAGDMAAAIAQMRA